MLEVFSFNPFPVSSDPEEVMISRRDTASVGEGDVSDLVGVEVGPLVGDLSARPLLGVGVVGEDLVAGACVFDVFVGAVCLEDLGSSEEA